MRTQAPNGDRIPLYPHLWPPDRGYMVEIKPLHQNKQPPGLPSSGLQRTGPAVQMLQHTQPVLQQGQVLLACHTDQLSVNGVQHLRIDFPQGDKTSLSSLSFSQLPFSFLKNGGLPCAGNSLQKDFSHKTHTILSSLFGRPSHRLSYPMAGVCKIALALSRPGADIPEKSVFLSVSRPAVPPGRGQEAWPHPNCMQKT